MWGGRGKCSLFACPYSYLCRTFSVCCHWRWMPYCYSKHLVASAQTCPGVILTVTAQGRPSPWQPAHSSVRADTRTLPQGDLDSASRGRPLVPPYVGPLPSLLRLREAFPFPQEASSSAAYQSLQSAPSTSCPKQLVSGHLSGSVSSCTLPSRPYSKLNPKADKILVKKIVAPCIRPTVTVPFWW